MQRSCNSGQKRLHCLVYQTITTRDRRVLHMYGPEEGRRHDLTLLRNSCIENSSQQSMVLENRQFSIYGDAAYIMRPWLQTAFPNLTATPAQQFYNKAMSAVREAVEWSYKDIKQTWSSQHFHRKLKVRQSPSALLYILGALFCNMKCCFGHGRQVSAYFGCNAPSIERYFSNS